MTRDKVLQIAKEELGTTENPPNSNKSKYGAWYGSGLDGNKWCAMFVSWVFDHAGIPLGNIQTKNGIHHCQSAHNYYKSKNKLTADPQPGDIVIFDWEGNGYADHIGIFKKWVNADKIQLEAYEGNTSQGNNSDGGMVMLRKRSRNSVKSFVNPGVYSEAAVGPVDTVLKIGSRGSDVTVVQKYLYTLGFPVLVDGWFGKQTEGFISDFQKNNHLNITGQADEITVDALHEAVVNASAPKKPSATGTNIQLGNNGILVVQIQEALNMKLGGVPKLDVTGVFDQETFKAVKLFQTQKSLKADGIVGPKTFAALGL